MAHLVVLPKPLEFPRLHDLIANGELDIDPLLGCSYMLRDFKLAFDAARSGQGKHIQFLYLTIHSFLAISCTYVQLLIASPQQSAYHLLSYVLNNPSLLHIPPSYPSIAKVFLYFAFGCLIAFTTFGEFPLPDSTRSKSPFSPLTLIWLL